MNMSLNRGIILTATTYAITDIITFTMIGNHILMTRTTLPATHTYKHYSVNNYENNSHASTHSPHVIHTLRIISHEGRAPHHDRYANKTGQYLQMRLLSRLVLQQFTMYGQLYVRFLVACRKSTYCSTKSFCGCYIWVILPSLKKQTFCRTEHYRRIVYFRHSRSKIKVLRLQEDFVTLIFCCGNNERCCLNCCLSFTR
jgi:hypothetical protein